MTQKQPLLLNADLGESFGAWKMGMDKDIMPFIDCANIATGFHASDPVTMRETVRLAHTHQVKIGAHPAYPDKEGFGRRSLAMSSHEISAAVLYQIGALHAICVAEGAQLAYVKPHGALYNDMMQNDTIFEAVLEAVAKFNTDLPLVVLALGDLSRHQEKATQYGITLWPEAFADRAYDAKGFLVSRSEPDSVFHERACILAQAEMIAEHGAVRSLCGERIEIPAVTLCVHGDNPEAVKTTEAIRTLLHQHHLDG
ncbi:MULTISPECIES: 5-oxoprolinase subunit PxpA [Gammaproteobacteria]|uniref:5-oxoprolinase subunit PxpA n=1 Tax=Gammaproteobacteria TaxID=1236 RepID=UPI000DCF9C44|nr:MULTISPECIES: 5-oxoprolinase subunit PxpA [Gammaproteobacteria]RTE87018.1 5-oxoprolinase subunit PxpA [Aliidiomarina sp. B3213]TCZ93192.1 5-oxoprolinase subunit PxpA [Lysobacter sp. N42]